MATNSDPVLGPSGCGECGFPRRSHWFTHAFVQPTSAQILARMLNRRTLRTTPGLMALPPTGATNLGHTLAPCGMSTKLERRARQTPSRWYCGTCGTYCYRSGGIDAGLAAVRPCTSPLEHQ